jgi:hypothetical protein
MTLPTVRIGDLDITRLIIGGNPFSGFSHQSAERDREMLDYYTVARIKQTLAEAEAAGINTCVLRIDAHIWRMLHEYRLDGGQIQWIAQQGDLKPPYETNVDQALAFGARAFFIHGAVTERLYGEGDWDTMRRLLEYAREQGLAVGIAAHWPQVHLDAQEQGLPLDFHMVCFYNCGSVHAKSGDRFDPADPPRAVAAIQQLERPCLAYKILGAGRREPREALKYAFAHIKPTDAVVVGVHTKDNPRMVEENAELVRPLLTGQAH